MKRTLLLMCIAGLPALADPLTLHDAVKIALEKHPTIEAAAARTKAAVARTEQARSGYFPKLSYTEFIQGSNNPVFAFGSLLNQRRFSQADFNINKLNSPGFIPNFQSQVGVEQVLYDFGATKQQVQTATIGRKLSEEEERLQRMQRVAAVARAYSAVQLTKANLEVANAAVKSAEADLQRAEAVRTAGMSTDADVLSIRVHLASTKEQVIRRKYDLQVAQAALNEALGLPLDTGHELTTPLSVRTPGTGPNVVRPEQRQAELAADMATAQRKSARLSLYPQIVARGMFEADRYKFVGDGGTNWFFGAGLRWNFDTAGSAARKADEAAQMAVAARASKRQVDAVVELQVTQAKAAVGAATERIEVAQAAVTQAEESLRIIKNRYEAGLTTINDLLRNEIALLEARTRRLAAIYEQRVAAVELELAAGRLTGDSDVLN